jgi:hypothetical protein
LRGSSDSGLDPAAILESEAIGIDKPREHSLLAKQISRHF